MKKIFWMDTETTGTEPSKHAILTLDALVEVDGEVIDQVRLKGAPDPDQEVVKEALEVNGLSREQILEFPSSTEMYKSLMSALNSHINRYDSNDKFIVAGHNVKFDIAFLQELFARKSNKYFGAYFNYHTIDTMGMAQLLHYAGRVNLPNFKLETLAKIFDVPFVAHDSLEDIKTTKAVSERMFEMLRHVKTPENRAEELMGRLEEVLGELSLIGGALDTALGRVRGLRGSLQECVE